MKVAEFVKGQILKIDFLSQIREPESDEFTIADIFHGGMGICLKVENMASRNKYALKTIQRDSVEDNNAWDMFGEEMKTWITLSACDGVAEAYCLVRINELPFVCAEWMDGGDLSTRIADRGNRFFFSSAIRIVRTLEWVYSKHQIIHRDLKPQNILLDANGRAFVTDWGLARPIANDIKEEPSSKEKFASRPELTKAGQFKGTILYASPEQILGKQNLDHRSDIYSLGCILYQWETGLPPFVGESAEEIAYMHLVAPVPKLGGFIRKTNFGVEGIIRKCLAKEPFERFQDYESLAEAIVNVARKRRTEFTPYVPSQRYLMPIIGGGEFQRRIEEDNSFGIRSAGGKHILGELDTFAPYVREANALMAIGDWTKAKSIYERLFVPELARDVPDQDYTQTIAVNYAICLIQLGEPSNALEVLTTLENANSKPAAYFVNLSLVYLHLNKNREAERSAKMGLALFNNDADIIGNLLISQVNQNKFDEALVTADRRLQLGRDIHTLEEIGLLFRKIGQTFVDTDLPLAVEHFKSALGLLTEAKQQNPRYPTARFNLAEVLFELRRFAEASKEFEHIFNNLNLHETVRELIVVKIAECLDQTAAHKDCLDFCNKWLEKIPTSVGLQRIRAETIVDGFCIGQEKDGTRVAERSSLEFLEEIVRQKDKRQISDLCYLARLYEWMGKANEAFEMLDEAETIFPNYWEIPYDRATFLWRRNDLESALSECRRSGELGPWHRQPWWLLSKIYEGLGENTNAEEASKQANFVENATDEMFDLN